jgi:hypothetical protein
MVAGPNTRYLGKFRGRVVDNEDPLRIGRITAEVPDVLGDEPSTWALPCLPFTGHEAGQYVVPEVGAGVWIEFEQGDPSFPVWAGCWYGHADELPPEARAELPGHRPTVIRTPGGHRLLMSDVPGGTGILLKAPGGAYVQIDERGVFINNGHGASIALVGDTVDINPNLNPTYVDDAQRLENVPLALYDLVLADPPYSVEDARHYGTTMISRNKVMRALEGLSPGAHVVWLDQVLPMYKKAAFEPEAVIGMWKSTNHRFRGITVFKRISSH